VQLKKIQIKFSNIDFLSDYAQRLPYLRRISQKSIEDILEVGLRKVRAGGLVAPETIYINFVNEKEINSLNREFRKKDQVTDVLSFSSEGNVSEVYVCPKYILKTSEHFKVSFEEELLRVVIHGILHICGYDHNKAFGYNEKTMGITMSRATKNIHTKDNIATTRKAEIEKMFIIQEKVLDFVYTGR